MNLNHGRDQNINYGNGTININNNTLRELHAIDKSFAASADSDTAKEAPGFQMLATKAAFSALHNSKSRGPRTRCLEGTRVEIIEAISNWIQSVNSDQLCWVRGGAGVGKSAIAQTICENFLHSRLIATFFFSRNDPSRNSLDPFIPTIAHQLATNPTLEDIGLTSAIDAAIRSNPGIFDMKWDDQFECLIRKPFSQIESQRQSGLPILIIIDGLDECMGLEHPTPNTSPEAQETLLSIIQNATLSNPPLPLRFLIFSRPESTIRNFFRSTPSMPGPVHKLLDVRDFRPEADRDIRIFLEREFAALPRLHPEAMLEAGWPGEDILVELIRKSDGHFVYVVTAMRYISQRNDPELKLPQQRLEIILRADETLYPDLSDLDQLYHQILRRFMAVREQMLLPVLQLLMTPHPRPVEFTGISLNADFPVKWRSRHAMATILDLDPRQVAMILSRLHSVFNISDISDSEGYGDVSFLHTSFSDFLTETWRSHEFHVQSMDPCSYFDKLSRRLFPVLTDMIHKYQAGDDQVQLTKWKNKIELWSTNFWTFVKETVVPKSSEASTSQVYTPSDELISAMNSFDIFQYANMLLDRKHMESFNAVYVDYGLRGDSILLLGYNVEALSSIYDCHSKSDSPLKVKLRPFLAALKAFFDGNWVVAFPKGSNRGKSLLRLTITMLPRGQDISHYWRTYLDRLEGEDRTTFLKVFPQGTNSMDQRDLVHQRITRSQRQDFATALVALDEEEDLSYKRLNKVITATLHRSSGSGDQAGELVEQDNPAESNFEEAQPTGLRDMARYGPRGPESGWFDRLLPAGICLGTSTDMQTVESSDGGIFWIHQGRLLDKIAISSA
ncbi:hypothetical protein V5O48_016768 [Marasmius crinis-equi]|uniref:Nephrocystin 3-like N-terminal domain-containing protein n=1 Tax=Marasmius crinis-equi TaxID=585013 RepID=A0ABR3ER28_9AGAR